MILANIGRRLRDLARIEDFEATLPDIADQKRKAPYPIIEAKWKLLETIDRALERVGLDRSEGKATSLADVVARYSKPADGTQPQA